VTTAKALITPVVVAAMFAVPAALADSARTITVHGTGIVSSVPTTAVFTFGVSANGATATAALSADAGQMTKVIAAIKAKGVAEADIQTAEVSLAPNRNQAGDKILNYTATNSVTARIHGIPNAGPVIDAAVAAGSNQLSGPTLAPTDQQLLSRRALKAAIADARARAKVIAAAAGVTLGAVRTVSEESNTPIVSGALSADRAASTPIQAGTVQTEADITVTFAIR
jgi:uncharacterized protein YggE